MNVSQQVRGVAEGASKRAVEKILPDGRLTRRRCERIWRGPDFAPLSAIFGHAGLAFAEAAAQNLQASDPVVNGALFRDLSATGAAPYTVIGDSHSLQMVRRATRDGRWLLPFHWLCRAASARGLSNADGLSGAADVVRGALDAVAPHHIPIFLKFGQVDIEFVYAFKRIESGLTAFDEAHYGAFVDETAERYAFALDDLVDPAMRPRTIIASVFPPALSDDAWAQGYINAAVADQHAGQGGVDLVQAVRSLEIPTLAVRTRMHARFNAKMRTAAADLGLGYLDCFTPFLGPDGLLDRRYRGRRDGGDHHLAFRAARGPVIAGLWRTFDELGYV